MGREKQPKKKKKTRGVDLKGSEEESLVRKASTKPSADNSLSARAIHVASPEPPPDVPPALTDSTEAAPTKLLTYTVPAGQYPGLQSLTSPGLQSMSSPSRFASMP